MEARDIILNSTIEDFTSISKNWNWTQLYSSNGFKFTPGVTPMAEWQLIPISWGIYFTTLIVLKIFMSKTEKRFSLTYIAAIHNLILCIWSAIMFVGIVISMADIISNDGFRGYYCPSKNTQQISRAYYWVYIYYLSKFWELFDTVILVLKRRPLIFLHVYHHSVVILMVWLWLNSHLLFASIGMMLNTFIHVFMYYFYYRTALGKVVWWKKYITVTQIIQFICSFLVSVPFAYIAIGYDSNSNFVPQCEGWNTFVFSSCINLSFLMLFANFYSNRYTEESPSSRKKMN